MSARPAIACLGAGRMARGIAVVFAYAGHQVSILDVKAREEGAHAEQAAAAIAEVRNILATFADFGLLPAAAVDSVLSRVSVAPSQKLVERFRLAPERFGPWNWPSNRRNLSLNQQVAGSNAGDLRFLRAD